tara:strand:- start:8666 stop:9172 length:507 start_codon:yes stop_codon:yes gene_type:complete
MEKNTELLCNYNYDNELNKRINTRYFPSQEIQPNFDPRPLSTKYSLLLTPPNNEHVQSNTHHLRDYKYFDPQKTFYTGNRAPPGSYFFDNINTETILRNQDKILTKYNDNSYIPGKNSELYTNIAGFVDNDAMTHSIIKGKYRGTDNKKCNLAPNVFFNTTRMNVKKI